MTFRGSTTVQDRIFASLPYLLPLMDVLPFGNFLLRQFPALGLIYLPLAPLLAVYSQPFVSLVVFFVLFLAVVRNEKIAHFVRFNVMQAILIGIVLSLLGLAFSILLRVLGAGLLVETLFNIIFLGTLAASFYGIVQSALGRYAEIPGISEASYLQVR
ncbi:MAG: Tic20 family protein [Coleofasciculaceae cyanobacterium]